MRCWGSASPPGCSGRPWSARPRPCSALTFSPRRRRAQPRRSRPPCWPSTRPQRPPVPASLGRCWRPWGRSSQTTGSRACPACTAAPTRPVRRDRCSSSRPRSTPMHSRSHRAASNRPHPMTPPMRSTPQPRLLCANGAAGRGRHPRRALRLRPLGRLRGPGAGPRRLPRAGGRPPRPRAEPTRASWPSAGRWPRSARPTCGAGRPRRRFRLLGPGPGGLGGGRRAPAPGGTGPVRRHDDLAPGEALLPGDLVFFGQGVASVDHVGLYVGTDGGTDIMVDAPHTGADVRAESFSATLGASFGALRFIGATRPTNG